VPLSARDRGEFSKKTRNYGVLPEGSYEGKTGKAKEPTLGYCLPRKNEKKKVFADKKKPLGLKEEKEGLSALSTNLRLRVEEEKLGNLDNPCAKKIVKN